MLRERNIKDIVPVVSIKERMIFNNFKRIFKEIQTPETIFTIDWLKETLKRTQSELYKLFPDKTFGQLSVSCFNDNFETTTNYGEKVYYVDISFHDRYTRIPWLVCRFYRKNAKVRFYLST